MGSLRSSGQSVHSCLLESNLRPLGFGTTLFRTNNAVASLVSSSGLWIQRLARGGLTRASLRRHGVQRMTDAKWSGSCPRIALIALIDTLETDILGMFLRLSWRRCGTKCVAVFAAYLGRNIRTAAMSTSTQEENLQRGG